MPACSLREIRDIGRIRNDHRAQLLLASFIRFGVLNFGNFGGVLTMSGMFRLMLYTFPALFAVWASSSRNSACRTQPCRAAIIRRTMKGKQHMRLVMSIANDDLRVLFNHTKQVSGRQSSLLGAASIQPAHGCTRLEPTALRHEHHFKAAEKHRLIDSQRY